MTIVIEGGQVLVQSGFQAIAIAAERGEINLDPARPDAMILDAEGLMVLPGIVDMHGDAFERQIEPRPGVRFPLPFALAETDRQLAANGITTAFHAVTCSWEPGLRSLDGARNLLGAMELTRDALSVDTRFHLRHEIFNLDAEPELIGWIKAGRVAALAFNDHMDDVQLSIARKSPKLTRLVEKTGLTLDAYLALAERVVARRPEIPASIARLAAAAWEAGIPILSHDDRHVEDRALYRALGARICEFPKTEDAAQHAIDAGEATVFGAPNVVRGGSQNSGSPSAKQMAEQGLCTILASDYFYPALAHAAHLIEADKTLSFAAAWALISQNPARALGLDDRGSIAPGLRADLVLARRTQAGITIVATIVGGRLVHLSEPDRIKSTSRSAQTLRNVA